MNPLLLKYYNSELQFIREMGAEFAHEFPKIAGRLSLEGMECADPYVERLLEGFAFLTARIQLKLDAEFPVFTQHLLSALYPDYLAPVPSMAVVQLEPDLAEAGLAAGFRVPRDTPLHGVLAPGQRTACEFRSAHEVTLWPLEIESARYIPTAAGLAAMGIAVPDAARAGLHLRLRATAGLELAELALERLPLHVTGAGELRALLFEQLHADTLAVLARGGQGPVMRLAPASGGRPIAPMGFDDDQRLLPHGDRGFQGFRLLQELFACPERFLFAELQGLGPCVRSAGGSTLDLFVLFKRACERLDGRLDANSLRLFCTPVVNLFPKRADRIRVRPEDGELHLVADRSRPQDFEIHTVTGVRGYAEGSDEPVALAPLFAPSGANGAARNGAHYALRREPRQLSDRQRRSGHRSGYLGSELYLDLVDVPGASGPRQLQQLDITCLCTNRDLPLGIAPGGGSSDFSLETGAPVLAVRYVAGPTRPRSPLAEGRIAWRLISQLSRGHLSLIDQTPEQNALELRELLELHCDSFDAAWKRALEGIAALESAPLVARLPVPGPIAFGRGTELTLRCQEAAFEGTGAFLPAMVLEAFLSRFATINSFTAMRLHTQERGEVMRWPPRLGLRRSL